jgi:hypothetical protein
MADDVVRIKTGMEVSYIANSAREDVIEIPRAEWEAKTPAEREAMLNDIAEETLANSANAWAYVDEEN